MGVALTPALFTLLAFGTFALARWAQRRRRWLVVLNPTLAAMTALALLAAALGLDSAGQEGAGQPLALGLELGIVALAAPLWEARGMVKGRKRALAAALAVGVVVGMGSAVLLGWALGLPAEWLAPLALKTFSSPFLVAALEPAAGAEPALPAALSVLTGVIGALILPRLMGRRAGAPSLGLGMGVSAHLVGTSRLAAINAEATALSALATVVMGLMLALGVALWPFMGLP